MSGRPGKGEGVVYFSEKHNPGGKLKHPGGSILVSSDNDPPAGERDTSWLQADKVGGPMAGGVKETYGSKGNKRPRQKAYPRKGPGYTGLRQEHSHDLIV